MRLTSIAYETCSCRCDCEETAYPLSTRASRLATGKNWNNSRSRDRLDMFLVAGIHSTQRKK